VLHYVVSKKWCFLGEIFMKKLLFFFSILHLQPLSASWNTIYAHGIVDDQTQMQRFGDAISTPKATAVEFCDAHNATTWDLKSCIGSLASKALKKPINLANMNMGQGDDIIRLRKAIENAPKNDQISLFGSSRGAATIINTVAENNPTTVQALVLDATPCDIPAIIKPLLAKFIINPNYSNPIFRFFFSAYPKDSIPPIQAIKQIKNKNLPILLIHSKTDQKVPVHNSYKMYQEFQRQGFTNVHLVILPDGKHGYPLQDEKIKPLYLQAVHSFYKKYNLPYNATWTNQNFDFDASRPSMQEMQDAIMAHETKIIQTYQSRAGKRNFVISAITVALMIEVLRRNYKDKF
jgi:pimeloyl-ACP methyl ester carboxylesterase